MKKIISIGQARFSKSQTKEMSAPTQTQKIWAGTDVEGRAFTCVCVCEGGRDEGRGGINKPRTVTVTSLSSPLVQVGIVDLGLYLTVIVIDIRGPYFQAVCICYCNRFVTGFPSSTRPGMSMKVCGDCIVGFTDPKSVKW